MSYNTPPCRSSPRHDEIAFSPINKQIEPLVTQAEQDWVPDTQKSPKHHSRSLNTLLREWKWELGTWLLGSCALACIVALLIIYRDRPLKEWTSQFLPAPVVATLSQVAQSALLSAIASCIGQLKWDWLRQTRSASDLDKFEEASRGPNGSLFLIFKTRTHLVSVGALATILLLGFSPATQLTNSIQVRNVEISGALSNATISRSVQYMNYWANATLVDYNQKGAFNTSKRGPSSFHPHMFRAILSGVLDDEKSVSDIKGNCSAEACTWEDYTTLAVCASVEEVSGVVFNDTKKVPRFSISGTDWKPPAQPLSIADSFWMAAPFQDSANVTDGQLPPVTNIYVAYYPPCDKQNKQRTYADWGMQINDASQWKAYKGTLNLCLQTLKSEYNNTIQTKIVGTQNELKWESRASFPPTVCLPAPDAGDEFCVGKDDLQQWTSAIARTWEGAASIEEDSDNYFTGQYVPNIVGDIMGQAPANCDPNMDPNYGLDGFKRRVDNIAIAMSNALRTGNTTSPSSIVRGAEWTSEQYIAVGFKWLIPPAFIWLAITFFLFATIIKSRKTDVPLWKSSPLVLLHSSERENDMQSIKQVEKEAEKTKVQLQQTGQSWHLQDVTDRHT